MNGLTRLNTSDFNSTQTMIQFTARNDTPTPTPNPPGKKETVLLHLCAL